MRDIGRAADGPTVSQADPPQAGFCSAAGSAERILSSDVVLSKKQDCLRRKMPRGSERLRITPTPYDDAVRCESAHRCVAKAQSRLTSFRYGFSSEDDRHSRPLA